MSHDDGVDDSGVDDDVLLVCAELVLTLTRLWFHGCPQTLTRALLRA
jgi:hypothetical protein